MNHTKNYKRIERTFQRIDRMRTERLNLPFIQFVALMPYMTTDTIKSLDLLHPPATYCKADVPKDLSLVTFGVLTQLQGAAKSNDYLKTCCELVSVLTGVKPERVASTPARLVLGIVNMVKTEMERIGGLFQSLQGEHTSEELSAGIDRLDFGTFGIVDWYAKRMGIVDHEEVFNTPWVRIYQCLKIDHENNEFEKRYRKIIERKNKK